MPLPMPDSTPPRVFPVFDMTANDPIVTSSEKVALTLAEGDTFIAPPAGDDDANLGGVVSCDLLPPQPAINVLIKTTANKKWNVLFDN